MYSWVGDQKLLNLLLERHSVINKSAEATPQFLTVSSNSVSRGVSE